MTKYSRTVEFSSEDQGRSLFPLKTNAVMMAYNPEGLGKHVYDAIAKNDGSSDASFLPQARVFADKSGHHLRRTFKLDPVAEFYIYDVVYRHRASFKLQKKSSRSCFGYAFSRGHVPPPSESYREFSSAVKLADTEFSHSLAFDVSSYFNSIYHHDLVRRFRDLVTDNDEVELFGRFFREINVGRSVDCLPHGIIAAKVIGSDFLSYIDKSNRLKSPLMLRFMDDFVLFANSETKLLSDFQSIQELLGSKGLSVNPAKTKWVVGPGIYAGDLDPIKVSILEKRRAVVVASEGPDEDDEDDVEELTNEEVEYLLALLEEDEVEEEDAELALVMLRNEAAEVLDHLPDMLRKYPNLTKNVFHLIRHIDDKSAVADILLTLLKSDYPSTQYQLFWFGWIAEKELSRTPQYGELLATLHDHRSASIISKARILEIPEKNHGMADLREVQLRSGGSGWLAWASAVGSACEKKASRNHPLGYFANASPINKLIADTVRRL